MDMINDKLKELGFAHVSLDREVIAPVWQRKTIRRLK
jgi:hypothetical protein